MKTSHPFQRSLSWSHFVASAVPRQLSFHEWALESNPQSQSFSRSYGSNLPNSLNNIFLLTRVFQTWRPDAVIGTIWSDITSPPNFHGSLWMFLTVLIVNCSAKHEALSLDNPISGRQFVKKKRKLFQGSIPTSLGLFVLPHKIRCQLEEY